MKRPTRSFSSCSITLVFTALGCATAADQDTPDATPVEVDALQTSVDSSMMPGPDASIDAGVPVDAPTPDACTVGWVELLQNGGFEMNSVNWTGTTSVIRQSNSPWPPEAGDYWALFLGSHNQVQELVQTMTIPATTTALRLRGQRCWVTLESGGTYDFLTIELRDDTGAVAETLWERDNSHAGATCAWSLFQLDAQDALAGQTVDLAIRATSDGASATSFGIDSLSLEAMACM